MANEDLVRLFDTSDDDEYEDYDDDDAVSSSSVSCSAADSLPPEPGEGNVEYKFKLVSPTVARFEHLVTQMKWRLREGSGEAIYEIGVEDNGLLTGLSEPEMHASLQTLQRMADTLGATLSILRQRTIDMSGDGGKLRKTAEVLIRKIPDNQASIDLRVAVLGGADAGKSTLLGVFTHGELDNGRGKTRLNLFRHLHEIQTGRTSSISHELLGFDEKGNLVNYSVCKTPEELCELSAKLITFIDLAGHQRYLKTTIFGLTGYQPHFAMLVVSATQGIVSMTREHLGLAFALNLPTFVVISKVDICSRKDVQRTLKNLEDLIKIPGYRMLPYRIKNGDDALAAAARFTDSSTVPIFLVSSVTGHGLELLTRFLNVLPPSMSAKERDWLMQEATEFQVDETYCVPSVGQVIGGLLAKGTIKESDELMVGPMDDGQYHGVKVHSVHRNRAPCCVVRAGQGASVAFVNYSGPQLRKGMMLLSAQIRPQSCLYFRARVCLLYQTQPVCRGFQATIYIGNIRQRVTILGIYLKSKILDNEQTVVMFQFCRHPEYLHPGAQLLFREGPTKGIGQVVEVYPLDNRTEVVR